jgi:RHS repeat-associated protein
MGTAGSGPAWFQVKTKDGRTFEYGNSTDSRIVANSTAHTWLLSAERDRAGNRSSVVWINDTATGSYRPDEINYATNVAAGVSVAPYQVKFVYEAAQRPDVLYGYARASVRNESKRLDRIDIKYQAALTRRFELTYSGSGGAGGRSLLTSVQECDGSGNCLSPTTFTYQAGTVGLSSATTVSALAQPVLPMDINGDGRDDLVYPSTATSGASTWRYRLANSSGGYAAEVNTGITNTASNAAIPLQWDADGRWDVLFPGATNWMVLRATGTGFSSAISTGLAVTQPVQQVADFNGDGRDDAVGITMPNGLGLNELRVYLNTGSGFSTSPIVILSGLECGGAFGTPCGTFQVLQSVNEKLRSRVREIDTDGDGSKEILVRIQDYKCDGGSSSAAASFSTICDTGYVAYTHWIVIRSAGYDVWLWENVAAAPLVGDFNDDHLTDFASPTAAGWQPAYSVGAPSSGTLAVAFGTAMPSGGLQDALAVALDYDSDGRDDVVLPSAGNAWSSMRATGVGFAAPVATGHSGAASLPMVADTNGDALHDLVCVSTTSLTFAPKAGATPDLLDVASDGFSVAANFDYAPTSNSAVYTRGTGTVYPSEDFSRPQLVVSQVTRTDGSGTGSTYAETYAYLGARRNVQGRGLMGFERITETDPRFGYNQKSLTTYRQAFPTIGQVAVHELQQSGGTTIRKLTNTWSALTFGTGDAARAFPYISTSVADEREAGGTQNGILYKTTTTTVAAVDSASGTITDRSTVTTEQATGLAAGATRTERTLISSISNDTTNWCLGRPLTTQQINGHSLANGGAITRTTGMTWDSLMCRTTQEQVEPGHATLQVTTVLGYDGFGNVNSRAVTGVGMTARTTTWSFGAKGIFAESMTNPLSQTSTYGFDYAKSVRTSAADPNNLATSWSHDGFGRETLEVRADGTRVATSRITCSGCDSRVRYTVQLQEQSTAGVTFRTTNSQVDQFERAAFTQTQRAGGGYAVQRLDFDARGRTSRVYAPYWAGSPHNGYRATLYDQLDRPVTDELRTAAGALDRQATTAYAGLASTVTDPRTNPTTYVSRAWGELARVTDAGTGSTDYQRDALRRLKQVTDAYSSITFSANYNIRGMMTSKSTMDAGTVTVVPNALGEVTSRTDAKAQTRTMTYDALGRMTQRVEPEGTQTFTWGSSAAAKNIGRLQSLSGPGYSESQTFDSSGRPATNSITSDATYQYSYAYNDIGALHTTTYPTGPGGVQLKIKRSYSNGYVSRIRDFTGNVDGTNYWTLGTMDPQGHAIDESYGNSLHVISGFSPLTGEIDYRQSGTGGSLTNVQNLGYNWDTGGNLVERQDLRQSKTEHFYYDNLDRLDYSTLNGTTNLDLAYNLVGNVTSKSDVGSFTFHATKKHAVTAAGSNSYAYDANGNMQTRNGSTIAWSSADLPTTINHGSLSAQFSYTPTRKRWRQSSSYSTGTETTIYVGSDLEKLTTSVRTHWKHRIHTPSGFVVVNRRSDGTNQTLYVPSDHLGSSDAVTDASGAVLVRPNFAGFGSRRDSDWDGAPPAADWQAFADTTRRGYTDHEMLDNVALVNMNGRVYEPAIGRFLSADPVHFPFGTRRAGNPYSYVENEPLSYRDPSGFTPIPAEEIIVTASRRGEWRSTWTPDECDIWGYSAAGCSWEAYRNRSSRETMEWFEYPEVGEYIAEIESAATPLPTYSPPAPLFDWSGLTSFTWTLDAGNDAYLQNLELAPPMEEDPRCGPDYAERYLDWTSSYLVEPGAAALLMFGGVWPKSLAPAGNFRGPLLGSSNPLTSVPRAFGVPGASAAGVQTVAAAIGVVEVGVGIYNATIVAQGFLYAIPDHGVPACP